MFTDANWIGRVTGGASRERVSRATSSFSSPSIQWVLAIVSLTSQFWPDFGRPCTEGSAQVTPVEAGIPWLGFVVYPTHRRVKARKVVQGTRRLSQRFESWRSGRISFAEFDASVNGWINHVRYADTWGLRGQVLNRFVWGPADRLVSDGDMPCG